MASELQNIVDELASRLDAPTVLEDHEERMVAYSSHSQPIDEVRRDSILRRATRREVMSWFRDQGIVAATGPLRIPGQPDQRILGRLDKAEKLCGFNLRDGHDRLAIHLGFKLARLVDLHPYPKAPPEAEGAGS